MTWSQLDHRRRETDAEEIMFKGSVLFSTVVVYNKRVIKSNTNMDIVIDHCSDGDPRKHCVNDIRL